MLQTNSEQLDWLSGDMSESRLAKEEAIDRVERHANEEWKEAAFRVGVWVAGQKQFITSDDIWLNLEVHLQTHEPRAMGAIMRRLAREGYIEVTDRYRPSVRLECHMRKIQVWRSKK